MTVYWMIYTCLITQQGWITLKICPYEKYAFYFADFRKIHTGHVFVKNSWSEFHDNLINSLVGNTKQKRGQTVSQSPFRALQFNYDNSNQRNVIRTVSPHKLFFYFTTNFWRVICMHALKQLLICLLFLWI